MSNLKVIVIVESLKISQSNNSFFPIIKMSEGLPWLNVDDLFSGFFDDSESFEELDDDFQKRTLYLRVENSLSVSVVWRFIELVEWRQLSDEVISGNESVSFGVELLKDLIQLSMAAGYSVCEVPSELSDDDLLISLW